MEEYDNSENLKSEYAKIVTQLQSDPDSIYGMVEREFDIRLDKNPDIVKEGNVTHFIPNEPGHPLEGHHFEHIDIVEKSNLFQQFFDKDSVVGLIITKSKVLFCENGEALTNCGAIVTKTIRKYQLGEECPEIEIELLLFCKDEQPEKAIIPFKDLDSTDWIDRVNPKYQLYERKKIHTIKLIIQQMIFFAPQVHKFNYSGWVDRLPAFSYNGILITPYSKNIPEDEVESCKFVFDMLSTAAHKITFPLFAAILLTFVKSKMMELGEYLKTTFILLGKSQSGKTYVASFFCDFEKGRSQHINFDSTLAEILDKLDERRDLPTIIDDCKPPEESEDARHMKKIVSTISRLSGDDSGGRQKQGNGKKIVMSRGLPVITAEHIPIQAGSGLARTYITEVEPNDVNFEKIKAMRKDFGFYLKFIKNYLKYIISQKVDSYCESLYERFSEQRDTMFTDEFRSRQEKPNNRTIDTNVFLKLGFDNFLEYAFSIGAISEIEKNQYTAEIKSILIAQIEYQSREVKKSGEIQMLFNALDKVLNVNPEKRVKVENGHTQHTKTALVFDKNEYSYLVIENAYIEVQKYYKRLGKSFMLPLDAVKKQLKGATDEKGEKLIILKRPDTPIVPFTVNKEHYDTVMFETKKFNKMLKGGQSNEFYTESTDDEMEADRLLKKQTGHH